MKKSIWMFIGTVASILVALGLVVALGLTMIQSTKVNEERYELVSHGENLIVFDRQTGEYWVKYMATNQGPSDWEKETPPITK